MEFFELGGKKIHFVSERQTYHANFVLALKFTSSSFRDNIGKILRCNSAMGIWSLACGELWDLRLLLAAFTSAPHCLSAGWLRKWLHQSEPWERRREKRVSAGRQVRKRTPDGKCSLLVTWSQSWPPTTPSIFSCWSGVPRSIPHSVEEV